MKVSVFADRLGFFFYNPLGREKYFCWKSWTGREEKVYKLSQSRFNERCCVYFITSAKNAEPW